MAYGWGKIQIGDGIFRYETVGNNYVTISGYEGCNGPLTFQDGVCHIHVPEKIEGLPVLKIKPMYLHLKLWTDGGTDCYGHNGSSHVIIHAPEYTAFWGLDRTRIDSYSVFTPAHRLQYEKRTEAFLKKVDKNVVFFARALTEDTCAIFFLSTGHTELQDNVWDPIPKQERIEIHIPEEIEGHRVTTILEGASLGVYPEAPVKLYIPDPVSCLEENNFNGFPYLEEVHLGRGLQGPGKNTFNFYEEEDEERLKKVPHLQVFHYGGSFAETDTEFSRKALADEYEDYADWGYMRVGQHHVHYPVEFIKLN